MTTQTVRYGITYNNRYSDEKLKALLPNKVSDLLALLSFDIQAVVDEPPAEKNAIQAETDNAVQAASPPDAEATDDYLTEPEPFDQFSSVHIRAARESQRTFLLPGSMSDIQTVATQADTRVAAVQTDSDTEGGVIFLDTGLPVAVVLLAKPTLFGLEVTLKGPPRWLAALPELTRVSDLNCLFSLSRDSDKPDNVQVVSEIESILRFNGISAPSVSVLLRALESHCPDSRDTISGDWVADCAVCCDNTSRLLWNNCGHSACPFCWKLRIVTKVSEGGAKVGCVMPDCDATVRPALIGWLAPWHALESWQNRNLDVAVLVQGGKYCPTPRCTTIILPEADRVPDDNQTGRTLYRCGKCSKQYCWSCREKWHWPCSCDAAATYRQLLTSFGDDPWQKYAAEEQYFAQTKSCPTCRLPMEKGEGCDHMSCNCGAHFCWQCTRLLEDHAAGETCTEKAVTIFTVEDGTAMSGWKAAAYKRAVECRNRRYALRRMLRADRELRTTLSHLFNILEYVSADQVPSSSRECFDQTDSLRDLAHLADMLLAHRNDDQRTVYIERSKNAVLKLQTEFWTVPKM